MKQFFVLLLLCVGVGLFLAPSALALYDNTSYVLGQFDVYNTTDTVSTTDYEDSIPVPNAYNYNINLGKVAYDATRHRLYVADNLNNRILVYETGSSDIIPVAEAPDYVLGQTTFLTNTAATSQSGLSGATGLTLDETNGRLFVADAGNCRVMIFDVSGTITSGMNAANYLGGGASFSAATCASTSYETTNLNQFRNPDDVAYDPDTNFLYVVDATKRRITIFDVAAITNGETATSVVLGDSTGNFSLSGPRGLDVDTTNNRLFVGDSNKNRVLVYDISALVSLEDPVNVLGQPDFATTTAGVTQAKLFGAFEVDFKSSTNQLAVGSSGGRVIIYDVASISNGEDAAFVLGQADFTAASSTIDASTTGNVPGLVWLNSDRLLVLDTRRLLEFNVTTITNGEAATVVLGQVDPLGNIKTDTRTANGVFESAYGMDAPFDTAIDTTNNRLYVADNNNKRVLIFNLDSTTKLPLDNQADNVLGASTFTTVGTGAATSSTFNPKGLLVDPTNNRLFVVDELNDRVIIFDVSSITDGEAAVNVLGQTNFTDSTGDLTDSKFDFPAHLAYDTTNQWLFVGESNNYRVVVFDLSSGITDGMAASKVIGQPDFTTADCNSTINGLCDIGSQITFDAATRQLYVTDSSHNRVMVYTIPNTLASFNNGMDASFVIGQDDFTSNDYTPTETRFNTPTGITITPTGMLLVQDCFNYRTLAYDVNNLANDPSPIGVLGQDDFSSISELGVTANTYDCAYGQGLKFDSATNRLYLADGGRNRVLLMDMARITTTSISNGNVGSSFSQDIASSQVDGTGSFSVFSGSLPTGTSLASNTISGTPTTYGEYPFTIRLTDTGTGSIGYFFTQQDYSISINPVVPSPTPSPSPTPTTDPSASPSPSPTPSPSPEVTAGAPNLGSPSSDSTPSNPPSFSWTAPAEPEKVESYTLLIDGQVLFSNLPANASVETADYILVYEASNHSYLLQLKKPLADGFHTWEVQAISTSGKITGSSSNSFTIGGTATEGAEELAEAEEETASPSATQPSTATSAAGLTNSLFPSPSPSPTPGSIDLREQAIQILGSFTTLGSLTTQTLENIKPSAPIAPAVATTVAAAAVVGFTALQVGSQLFNPKVLLEVLRALGLLAQKPPQGMIFDAATFIPIPFALITLTNKDKTLTETVVTDMYGVYRGVKLPPGEYQLLAAHQEYSFPTAKKRPSYFGSRDFYQGEVFGVTSEKYQQLFLIPMDDMLQRQRKRSLKATLSHLFGWILQHQTQITSAFFALSLVMTYLAPTLLNIVLTTFYGLLVMKKLAIAFKAPLVSGVVSGPQDRPLSGAIVRFADPSSNELKALAQTDDKGTFKAFIEKGTYQVAATKLGYLWQEASMSLNQMTFSKPTAVSVKMQKAEAINLFS